MGVAIGAFAPPATFRESRYPRIAAATIHDKHRCSYQANVFAGIILHPMVAPMNALP